MRKRSSVFVLLGFIVKYACTQHRHDGESQMFPDERTTLDDCHLRFYDFYSGGRGGIGGFPVRQFEFAHMGAIGWTQPDGRILWQCGGSLIWNDFVLTAAHCVVDARDKPPDRVRFGDINILTEEGDETAQELKIVEIVRHSEHRFSGHYHDIALMRLEKSVMINEAVVPACLWIDQEVRFKQVDATGWGKVGFDGQQSPVLLKMKLKPIPTEECSKVFNNETSRKLRRGLLDQHICAFDLAADTCEGDSGGPLQVKLMHNMRESPFIVGLTSFGLVCGTATPGVYTRIATYHDWIIDTMKKRGANVDGTTFKPTVCARRYAKYREMYERVVTRNPDGSTTFDHQLYEFSLRDKLDSQVAKLGWHNLSRNYIPNCFGILIDEDTVLTVAECAELDGVPVDHIVTEQTVNVSKVYIHPGYTKGSGYNNIAILKLSSLLDLRSIGTPACIWHESSWPFGTASLIGIGRADLIESLFPNKDIEKAPSLSILNTENQLQNRSTCIVSKRHQSRLKHGLAQEHVCTGNKAFLVPEICDLLIGGSLNGEMTRAGRQYTFTLGLTQFGLDCGFGEHTVATRLASHVEWMNSILLPHYQSHGDKILFVDRDLEKGEHCQFDEKTAGRCVAISECHGGLKKHLSEGSMKFCSTSNVICCPMKHLEAKNQTRSKNELETCPDLLRELQPSSVGWLVQVGFDTEDWYDFRCLGSIITNELVLTTASCVGDEEVPLVVQLSTDGEDNLVDVYAIAIHEDYNATDGTNDIAVIKLNTSLVWSKQVFPACLWTNQTHTPLVMKLLQPTEESLMLRFILPMYNTDCQRTHPHQLIKSQLCGKGPLYSEDTSCVNSSDVLISNAEDGVVYLVGLAQNSSDCASRSYVTFTRVSRMVEWIEQFLDQTFWDD